MINTLMGFVRDAEARSIPPYQQFLRAQKTFITNRYMRFLGNLGHESPGVKLLSYILSFVDYEYLDKQINNYDRYLYHLRFIRRDLENIFDRLSRGRGFKYLFFKKSSFYTEEFLLPVEDVNTIVNLPLDTEDWREWRKVKPLFLWYHNSNEFTTNIINDNVHFKLLPPSYAVELLDVVALTFKYFIWMKHQRQNEEAEELARWAPQQLFLHKYVITPWVWDLGDIWLLNCLSSMLDIESIDDLDKMSASTLQVEQQYGWVATNSKMGFEYLWKMTHELKKNLRPEALLSSKILFSGSINDRIRLIYNRLTLPIHRQYEYLRWIRDKELLKFFVKVFMMRPELPTTKRLLVNVRRDFGRMLRRAPWNVCQSITLKNKIRDEMEEFNASIKDKK